MSDTPRLDALTDYAYEWEVRELAAQLERELGQARELTERIIDSIEYEYGSDHSTFIYYRNNYEQLFNVKYEIKDY